MTEKMPQAVRLHLTVVSATVKLAAGEETRDMQVQRIREALSGLQWALDKLMPAKPKA